jgi:hypothetical protein
MIAGVWTGEPLERSHVTAESALLAAAILAQPVMVVAMVICNALRERRAGF